MTENASVASREKDTQKESNAHATNYGAKAKDKLFNVAATGQPEEQLRTPFDHLLADLAELSNIPRKKVVAVGESSLSDADRLKAEISALRSMRPLKHLVPCD